jgi:uncharacterized membrane protein
MKRWYQSRTLWINIIAIVALALNHLYGIEMDAELQSTLATTVLAIINIVLRVKTNQGLTP